jgi:hypothetical protein
MSAPGCKRAPANGAPDRYAAVPDLRVSGLDSGGSTPLATALTSGQFKRFLAFGSVTTARKSVTHVLNLNCYLCIDCTFVIPLSFVHLSFLLAKERPGFFGPAFAQ